MNSGFAQYEFVTLSSEGPTNLLSVSAVLHMKVYKVIQTLLHDSLIVWLALGKVESSRLCERPFQAWIPLGMLCWPVQITTK